MQKVEIHFGAEDSLQAWKVERLGKKDAQLVNVERYVFNWMNILFFWFLGLLFIFSKSAWVGPCHMLLTVYFYRKGTIH